MSDTDASQAPPVQSEQIPDDQTKDIPTLQGYLRLKERTACQIKDIELFDPDGANVDVLDYINTMDALSLPPIEAYEITSDTQLAQLLQTRSSVAYSVLKIGGLQTKVSLCRSVVSPPPPPPDPDPPNNTGPKQEFLPQGEDAPIRGNFDITAQQLSSICTGSFANYKLYAGAITDDSAHYGINPLFVLANLANQGVYAPYRNPWGISTDYYPYGPGGSQLGQSNGTVRNGPRKFGPDEWRIAFDRQFAVVASGKAYKSATTIAEWAKIDAPAGAENDVHGTNAQEGRDVGGLYNRLVKALGSLKT